MTGFGPARFALLALALVFSLGATSNWNTVVTANNGGHQIGNPAAKVKLIEFVSYTCPHCAHFATDGDGALQLAYVGPGKVQVEVRHVIRDPIDLTVAMLTNCGPADRFRMNHATFMLKQSKWIAPLLTASNSQRQRWYTGDNAARRRAIASDFGLYEIMAPRGYTRPEVDRCLNDEAMAKRLAAVSAADAEKWGVKYTPSFVLNGVLLTGTATWEQLYPQIDARL
jgi:protein-disulfide isomerase